MSSEDENFTDVIKKRRDDEEYAKRVIAEDNHRRLQDNMDQHEKAQMYILEHQK